MAAAVMTVGFICLCALATCASSSSNITERCGWTSPKDGQVRVYAARPGACAYMEARFRQPAQLLFDGPKPTGVGIVSLKTASNTTVRARVELYSWGEWYPDRDVVTATIVPERATHIPFCQQYAQRLLVYSKTRGHTVLVESVTVMA
jgi:hypothetical protein